jgi:stage V sporulation protein R
MTKPLFKAGDDWSHELLEEAWHEIETIAKEDLKQTYYKPQIEVITAAQMLDAYTSVGMPIMYRHWSFGKELVQSEEDYATGKMGLAYEIVINSDPCIAYLMEENTMLTQTLVIAHASIGHSAVFKHNYLFKERTDAAGIVDYLNFAKKYIADCEDRYGIDAVEEVLDAAHSLQNYGVDRYKRPQKMSPLKEMERANARLEQEAADYNHMWDKLVPKKDSVGEVEMADGAFKEPQENLLYLIEKRAPHLEGWKREIIRIVRKLGEYFSPQGQTKVLNEGYASFCHYYILTRMEEKGLLDSGSMIEFYAMHSNVLWQRPFAALNPYKLGFMIFMEIKRLCEGVNIDDEDRQYGANLIGKDWREETHKAMSEYRDETFILQFLTPKIARELKLFSIRDYGDMSDDYIVMETTRQYSFEDLRQRLADQHRRDYFVPDLQAVRIDRNQNNRLVIQHNLQDDRPLDERSTEMVLRYLARLWQHDVVLRTYASDDKGGMTSKTMAARGKYSI